MSLVCTHFSYKKLFCPSFNSEINTTEVRTVEPHGHLEGDMSSLAQDKTGDQEQGSGRGIMNFTATF